jgi:hypothetical protein
MLIYRINVLFVVSPNVPLELSPQENKYPSAIAMANTSPSRSIDILLLPMLALSTRVGSVLAVFVVSPKCPIVVNILYTSNHYSLIPTLP